MPMPAMEPEVAVSQSHHDTVATARSVEKIVAKSDSFHPQGTAKRKKEKKLPQAISDPVVCDDETILRELCVLNGVNYEKLHHGIGAKVDKLEIFFFGFPRIPLGLDQFPSLLTLCIVNQRFNCMLGLEACPLLQELWICETQLKKIEGLHHCRNLIKLHLYSNCITRIDGLESLLKLEKLWLSGNAISTIEGLSELLLLKDLNLAGNKITVIGKSLCHLSKLESLDLSGNSISSLAEIVYLSSLSKLSSLSLCHPMYSPNPVCCLCNYSTHTLYHFPQLKWLDGREVGSLDLQKLVQGLVLRKIQYYRMQTHHCHALGKSKVQQLQYQLKSHLGDCRVKFRTLSRRLKFLGTGSDKQGRLNALMSNITGHIRRSEEICSEVCAIIDADTKQRCQFWMMELNSGGNVKLIPSDQSQPSFNSCSELVHSRFSVADVESMGINGLEVTEVIRVENRLLFNRFNDKLKSLLDKEPYLSMTATQLYKKMVDYLFLVWREEDASLCDICQDGFSHPAIPSSASVIWLTNSVNIADHLHLAQQGRGKVGQSKLILCKVFIGQAAETSESTLPSRGNFPNANSVYRVHGGAPQDNSTDLYSKHWFIFDASLVLPEYIIYFNYLSPHFPENALDAYISSHSLPEDEDNDFLVPSASSCPRLAMLDGPTLLELTGHPSISSIQEINICDNRLTRFRLAPSLPQMTQLVLGGNELTVAEDFANLPNLAFLDLSFNKFTSLQGLKGLPKLEFLDISWNFLTSYFDDLGPLRKHCPALESLDTRHNPWKKMENLRCYVVGRIRTLHTMDGRAVSQEEVSEAIRSMLSSHLTLATLLGNARVEVAPLPSLSVVPIAQAITQQQPCSPRPNTPGTDWCNQVTTVCLDNLGLRKLAHLDQLPNLRWLSLASNALTSLEGLFQCTKLEELTLDNNLLSSVSGVGKLNSLQWLSLSNNQLVELPTDLWSLVKLRYLNMSYNALSTLHELKQLTSLMELYISANSITNQRELFYLKSLCCLIVLDLTFNPVVTMETYRSFAVFHLPFLKALDGRSITYRSFAVFHLPFLKALDGRSIGIGEVAGAKEKLGGQLTQDFVFQKYPSLLFKDMLKLDLPNCGLKHVDLRPVSSFNNLSSLNLENNSLTSFSGLVFLDQLKVLCLNHNRIEQIFSGTEASSSGGVVLQSLQVLHLAYNGISNLANLHLNSIPSLKALFLQGNEISNVEGVEQLASLTELVLDRNKIKSIQECSFYGLNCLKELHLEENRLRDLSNFKPLHSLERLYLGLNRVTDYHQLEKISHLQNLIELSIISNPVSRRLQHRVLLIYQHPALASLDGVAVSAIERQAAEVVFGGEAQESEVSADVSLLPGLSGATPLRVMNLPFSGSQQQQRRQPHDSRILHRHMQNVQGFHDRRRRGKN